MSRESDRKTTAEEGQTIIVEKDARSGVGVGAFLLGAVVGAGLALLFAPRSGEETQRQLRRQARWVRELTGDRVKLLREDLGSRVGAAKGVMDQGRQIATDARGEVEEKLGRTKAAYRAGLEAVRARMKTPERDNSRKRENGQKNKQAQQEKPEEAKRT